ncbi:ATP-grasp domain-containing protein [Aetokthonos hydrillicola Thurmond2011]|uniref:ATP-grasp domain-containing protein n=1 Tax=Aetokthonos hydrillicola Thurmond2011 TaxID=2712845 RepID=A0AAP5I8T0_9CYAN|nr:ATP-grasp domain-containing protein [Aetokthonos hydrillicola]MBO3458625.1 ATP-grasp domain-containing protein [Aetokthonos hydrillicola CCALA 1050]MBW4587978.1 ATP-grasp domain-containing protein [Aetokthonos hydrillicola CCALA 1050]MDR9897067.1 ATP-grasp domain-containing protein [Aetokthonos hydrillicola Thurmond2011]
MNSTYNFQYFQGNSLSDLFAQDLADASYGFILNYPATASWAAYPNTKKYFLQDGSSEATKTSFDKICQKEPWKNLAVLGDRIQAIVIVPPSKSLINYWREHLDFSDSSRLMMHCSTYLDDLSQSEHFDKLITLFPFDNLKPEKHAINSDTHYRLLSKVTLAELGVSCPKYKSYNLHDCRLEDIHLPEFPYLIKTSHGLSGEGTYIINNTSDLNYCLEEIRKYLDIKLLDTIIVSEFIKNEVQNYCVQFYVNKVGDITLIGTTSQLVTPEGNYLGGVIDYRHTNMGKFFEMIAAIGQYGSKQGYFGVIGFDVLETQDGQLYAIDANFRVNGSTPLCLQRHTLLNIGKEVAKYSSSYRMDGTLESILVSLKPELDRKDFIILSALERVKYGKIYTEIYAIVTGETIEEMRHVERKLQSKGLQWLA